VKFGSSILNTYVPDSNGGSRDIYAKWLEQIDAAGSLGFDSLWVTEDHFRHFGGLGQDKVLMSMERCAKSVLPALRAAYV